MKKEYIIGVIGGMGSYATLDFFRRLLEAFPAKKEWERPRIILDNYCTMPSRVRAILYGERKDELIADLSKSAMNMCRGGVSRMVLACNTSHVFLHEVEKHVPECKDRFIHIINTLAGDMKNKDVKTAYLLATEGTIDCGIYSDCFSPFGIKIVVPQIEQYSLLRGWIEAVKQNCISDSVLESFTKFIDECSETSLILGCTELPILYARALQVGWKPKPTVFDPLESVIDFLKKEYHLSN